MRCANLARIGTVAIAALAGAGCQTTSGPGWIELFNGKDLAGWTPRNQTQWYSWKVVDGILVNQPDPQKGGVDIYSDAMLDDFDLHTEFKVPPNSNSGVYLRGRYEIQINSHSGPLDAGAMGAIYSLYAPSENASKPWDEWQVFDATIVGKTVTVKLNGKTIIDKKDLPHITGGTMREFADPSKPGPIMLQGDHGPIRFRTVRVRPIPKAAPK